MDECLTFDPDATLDELLNRSVESCITRVG